MQRAHLSKDKAGLALPVTSGDIIVCGVATDIVQGIGFENVLAIASDDNHQFTLVIALVLRNFGNWNWCVVIHHCWAWLGEDGRAGG